MQHFVTIGRNITAFALVLLAWAQPAQSDSTAAVMDALFNGRPTPFQANLPDAGLTVPAQQFPCANCHGAGAEGGAEGAQRAPSLLPSALFSRSPARPPYTAKTFHDAVVNGASASGNPLSFGMPRYQLSEQETLALMAVLQGIEAAERQGVASGQVTFGVATHAPPTRFEQHVLAELKRAAEKANAAGLHYGRMLRIEAVPSEAESPDVMAIIGLHGDVTAPHLFPFLPPEDSETASWVHAKPEIVKALLSRAKADGHRSLRVIGDSTDSDTQLLLKLCASAEYAANFTCHEAARSTDTAVYALSPIPEPKRLTASMHVYGNMETLLPQAAILKARGVRMTLADPHPELTTAAMRKHESVIRTHAVLAISTISSALNRVGRDLTRQKLTAEIKNAMRNPRQPTRIEMLEF